MMFKAKFRSPLMMFLCITLIFMALLTVRPSITYACSCAVTTDPLEALERSSAVFIGIVADVKEPKGIIISSADPVKVTFEVNSSWKGVKDDKVILTTALSSASCGFKFTKGESYIVYAREERDSGKLTVSLCSRTAPLSSAGKDLDILGPSISSGSPTEPPEGGALNGGADPIASPEGGALNGGADPIASLEVEALNGGADKPLGTAATGSGSSPMGYIWGSAVAVVLVVIGTIVTAALFRRRGHSRRK
jgi:hypothetical protein